jgi:hypothetical protein
MSEEKGRAQGKPEPDSTSWECVDLVIDKPGDRTMRPSTGVAREIGLREQEKLARWEALYGHLPPEQRPPEVVNLYFEVSGKGPAAEAPGKNS